jgi:multidrug efflux system membrane fusion protein
MPKFRFHKVAAIVVLVGFAAWMGTGEFSSVGSASTEDQAKSEKPADQQVAAPVRTVGVVTPPRQMHARAIRISGLTEADKRATLTTRVAGVIKELPVGQGDRVKQGDLILSLDTEDKEAAVKTAQASLDQREAEFDAAERLAKSGNIAKLQLDSARSALAAARSQLEAARAELDKTRVLAPFDGLVDRVEVEKGSSVAVGAEVATMLNLDPVVARGEISERDLRFIKVGDKADVRLVNDDTVDGEIRYISRDASPQTRTFRVEIAIPNPDNKIPAGMTSEITLRGTPTDSVVLPRSVVTLSNDGDLGIRAVDKDSKVVFYPIDLIDDTPHGLVLGGIPADARVIVAGQELVTEGEKVKAVEADQETIKKLVKEATGGTQ